ncbi:tRNA-dihydrouridine synthase 2 [Kickxella alabastrina]|uniref:tRNA-dihydrouridine synthase 2 n=1 Tax=Kickxella alabastrina TaxID=61397 RepID=A0ACC1IMU7_9FUNG|nr:tRNA-dihydrouridine synthase 2 [Kickxella alabastrina]
MVRIGSLPMRLLCLEYGADLVWSPEIVDKSIVGAERVVDEKSGIISYIKNDKDVFATLPSEKDKLIFQLGAAEPEMALAAAKTVEQDVSGIDLNCGCPKSFSILGGMGAALMADPDRLCAILDILVKNLNVPVTCKIRIFDDVEKTLELVRRIAATGITALTVHCRTRAMRPSEKAVWGRLRDIVKELPDLPIILNGDVFEYKDVQRARDRIGVTSVMTARGAAANPSIFRAEGKLSAMHTAVELTKICVRTSNIFLNTKFILLQMHPETKSDDYIRLRSSRRYKEMCEAMGLAEFYESEGAQLINDRAEPAGTGKGASKTSAVKRAKKRELEDGDSKAVHASKAPINEGPVVLEPADAVEGSGPTDAAEERPAKRIKA